VVRAVGKLASRWDDDFFSAAETFVESQLFVHLAVVRHNLPPLNSGADVVNNNCNWDAIQRNVESTSVYQRT